MNFVSEFISTSTTSNICNGVIVNSTKLPKPRITPPDILARWFNESVVFIVDAISDICIIGD